LHTRSLGPGKVCLPRSVWKENFPVATEFQFLGEYANGTSAYSSTTSNVTVTAAIDDGVIDVGDAVTMSGLSSGAGFSFNGGFTDGDTLYYHGNGVFDGITGYVFSKDPVLSLPGPILVLTDQAEVPSAGDAASELARGLTTQTLGTEPACFLAGTMIETVRGPVAVEDLAIGAQVRTVEGNVVEVKWVGRQTLSTGFGQAHRCAPVRIRAGALSHGCPDRDLLVTANHGVVIAGLVINASALINGSSVIWQPLAELGDSFTVYHIETENHDVILANGAPSETFIDVATRRHFDNFDEYLALYGAERIIPEMSQPRISSARLVPTGIRARLGPGRADVQSDAA
jgi:hypothetical protein